MLGEKLTPAEGNPTPNSVCSIPGVSSPDKIMSLLSQSLSETTQYWHCVSFARVCFHLSSRNNLGGFPIPRVSPDKGEWNQIWFNECMESQANFGWKEHLKAILSKPPAMGKV